MRWLVSAVTVACLVATLSAADFEPSTDAKYGDENYLKQQEKILENFKYLTQSHWNAELYKFGVQYHIEDDYENYNNVEKVKRFVDLYKTGRFLKKGAPFNVYDPDHVKQADGLFNLLANAKTYETAIKACVWMRFIVNEKLFAYVIGLGTSHFKLYETHTMPPFYEVYPYQFINAEAIKKAERIKMQGFYGVQKVNGYKEVIIPVNYTGWYIHMNDDQKVSYYTEDVGLNEFYYNYNVDYPHWMKGEAYGLDKDRRGELFIYYHHVMYARYYLERLSIGLGHISEFNWREPFKSGYVPHLMHSNGEQMPTRSNNYKLNRQGNYETVQKAEDRENKIRDVADLNVVGFDGKFVNLSTSDYVNVLGNLLHGNADGYGFNSKYYDHLVPSFLQNFVTASRDPMFYSFYKYLIKNYWNFMSHMEPYTTAEIGFPGVEILSTYVDKIETFFENFDVDITNLLVKDPVLEMVEPVKFDDIKFKPDEYFVKARTVRLNHKPFNYKIIVNSGASHEAIVRVFLGPKYDEFGHKVDFEENRKNFIPLDIFKETLKVGRNVIIRNSDAENFYYAKPLTTYFELYKNLLQSQEGKVSYPKFLNQRCKYPRNLKIPKGSRGGTTFQFYFIVSPFQEPKVPFGSTFDTKTSCGIGSGSRFLEDRPLLFPLDREIDAFDFYTPNMKFNDVEIYFKEN